MMLRKTLALVLVAGLALMGAPLSAQNYAPNTVWGEVPATAASAAYAVLLDASGNTVATVPVVDGKFIFENVPPGEYAVMLTDAASAELARSQAAQMAADGVVKALFADDAAAAAVIPASGGGIGTTGWVLIGAGAAGLVTAIVIASDDDEGAASPAR